jgi:hypothetical protein
VKDLNQLNWQERVFHYVLDNGITVDTAAPLIGGCQESKLQTATFEGPVF